jgi:hypothetical protein
MTRLEILTKCLLCTARVVFLPQISNFESAAYMMQSGFRDSKFFLGGFGGESSDPVSHLFANCIFDEGRCNFPYSIEDEGHIDHEELLDTPRIM